MVQTGDGYLLGLHRLCWRKGEEDVRVNAGEGSVQKRAVYLHHGLLMNSEVWVCMTEQQRCLPFILVEKGYDVWVSLCQFYHAVSTELVLTSTARKQSWEQVLEEVDSIFSELKQFLGLFNGSVRLSRHSR